MKIYFANNKYLKADSIIEEYRSNNKYLTFNIKDSSISFDTIIAFFSDKNNLQEIIVTTDENKVITNFENTYCYLYNISRAFSDGENVFINVQLSDIENISII